MGAGAAGFSLRYPRVAAAAAALLAFAYLYSGAFRQVDPYDEGIPLVGAWRVLRGDVPYRDFWTLYSPGQFYSLAGVFVAFGIGLDQARIWDAGIKTLLVFAMYLLSRECAERRASLAASLVALLWLERSGRFNYTIFPALLFAFIALKLWARNVQLLCGLAVGAAAVYRLDFGAYLFASLALATFITRGKGWTWCLTACTAAAALYAPIVLAVPWPRLWDDLVFFPLTIFPRVRGAQLPVFSFELYAPFLLLIASLLGCRSILRSSGRPAFIAVVFLALALTNQFFIRPDFSHALPLYLPALVLAAALAENAFRAPGRGAALQRAFLSVAAIPLLGVPLQAKFAALRAGPAASGSVWSASQASAIEWVRAHTAPGEPILVGLPRHDVLMRNDIAFYFLADRPCAGPYHELHPGKADQQDAQEEIIRALEKVRVVVSAVPYPFELLSFPSSSAAKLDRYIGEHFQISVDLGDYKILLRKD